jgi:hypothetical protein
VVSAASSGGGGGVSGKGSRSGSINWGPNRGVGNEKQEMQDLASTYRKQSMDVFASSPSSSSSWRRHPHPHPTHHTSTQQPHERRTTLADLSATDNLAHFDTHSGIGVRQPLLQPTMQSQDTRKPPVSPRAASSELRRIDTAHPSNGGGAHVEARMMDSRSPVSLMSPSSMIHSPVAATNKPLFHPDLHPVTDHHASSGQTTTTDDDDDDDDNDDDDDGAGAMNCQIPSTWSSSSLPVNATFTFTDALSTSDDTSPSSSSTVRPPLVQDGGKPKAHTVADYRARDEEWMV